MARVLTGKSRVWHGGLEGVKNIVWKDADFLRVRLTLHATILTLTRVKQIHGNSALGLWVQTAVYKIQGAGMQACEARMQHTSTQA